MWPATGSSGSTSPRKRSGARASTSSSVWRDRLASTPTELTVGVTLRTANVVAAGVDDVRGHGTLLAGPLGEAAVEHCDGFVAEPAQHPPQARGVGARALVVGDDLLAFVDAEPPKTSAAQASGVGSGWRPLVGRSWRDRSRSRCTNTARGMCDLPYSSSPHDFGEPRSWRTSNSASDGSSRRAASSSVEMSVVSMTGAAKRGRTWLRR